MPVMPRLLPPRGLARTLFLTALAVLELAPAGVVSAQESHKQVLVLYSTGPHNQFSIIGERELPRILDVGPRTNLDYYSEFIDSRFPDPSFPIAFGDFLRLKYRGIRFDLVIAMQDVAVEFVNRNRDSLFPDAPVVFLANDRRTASVGPNSTGLIQERKFTGTLALIEKLQPDARNVFVVTGAGADDKAFEDAMRSQMQSFESRLTVNYLSGLPTDELERRLAGLPQRSVVYYLRLSEDGAGNKYHPLLHIDRVAAVANAPTYSWVDSALDHGIVGGNLYSQIEAIRRTGQLALRVLGGEKADSIDTSAIDVNSDQVDWRQLRRWDIDEARVPAGTVVSFRDPTIWDRYKGYILAALALLIVQSGLIAGLLIQRARRHHAEVELRRSQDSLRTSYERIRHLGSRMLKAQETERSRIARELHDDINQQLALLTMDLDEVAARRSWRRQAARRRGTGAHSGDWQKRARLVAQSASGQAPADWPRRRAPDASPRVVTFWDRHRIHARQRAIDAFGRCDAVSVPRRSGGAPKHDQVQPGQGSSGASRWEPDRAHPERRRRWRGI